MSVFGTIACATIVLTMVGLANAQFQRPWMNDVGLLFLATFRQFLNIISRNLIDSAGFKLAIERLFAPFISFLREAIAADIGLKRVGF